ncbi:hypothetical protein [Paenibacillus piri]|uniref:hypothetical protein n=1 Tax=Paenibacillus piri TaxID=2547395 RepID=UPI001C705D5C|nr:hypothetical protein [Paenibacillus piri]
MQTNWKASVNSWDLMNEGEIERLMNQSNEFFNVNYDYEIYKGNASFTQLIQQAEIDVIGVAYANNEQHLYAIDVAFHEAGLNYGTKEETIMRIVKKTLRAAMCIYGYFGYSSADIIFASPKINNNVMAPLSLCLNQVEHLLRDQGLNYNVRLLANDEFGESILQPVLAVTSFVADTSELFMRSLQMYNLFANKKQNTIKTAASARESKTVQEMEKIEVTNISGLTEMKIGALVRSTLIKMFQNNEISPEEVALMQTSEYSKKTFDIQYPLLIKSSLSSDKKVLRYWAGTVEIYGDKYFICSEWYEVPQNNDRPYFMKWLQLRKEQQ